MEKLRKILYIDSSWKVMYILIRRGIMIKSVVSLKSALSLLTKQNFDLILTEPLNLEMLAPYESIQNKVTDILRILTNECPFELLDSQTAMV